ncbi:MAG: hypothetical protein LBC85_03645 [Fibromonadaceae bacterium]|nr:hypothetical protein [Fibromonadaceae bacterium]
MSLTFYQKRQNRFEQFFVGNRSYGTLIGAVSSAAAWIWAPALFTSSQIVYTRGLPGIFWFAVPNTLALIMFAFFAVKVRSVIEQGYTLPEYIKHRLGVRNQMLYNVVILFVQFYAVLVQLTGSLLLLNLLTGLSKPFLIIIIAFVFVLIASIRGIRSSVVADVIKMVIILSVTILVVPITVSFAGGFDAIAGGLGGSTGTFTNLFDPSVAWAYGIPITISLLAGVTVDQQQWQRAFSMKKENVKRSFLLAGVIFIIVPVMLSMLGFIAANPSSGVVVSSPQLAGIETIAKFLPSLGVGIFAIMLLSALTAAGSSALCAISSITVVDIYKRFSNKNSNDMQLVVVARIAMIIVIILAVGIAMIPNISILYLQLLAGSFRAALFIPTILTLFWGRLHNKAAFWGSIIAMSIGVPLFVYGSIIKNVNISTTGTIISLVLSGIICLLASKIRKLA